MPILEEMEYDPGEAGLKPRGGIYGDMVASLQQDRQAEVPQEYAPMVAQAGQALSSPEAQDTIEMKLDQKLGVPEGTVTKRDMQESINWLDEFRSSREKRDEFLQRANDPSNLSFKEMLGMGLLSLASTGVGAIIGGVHGEPGIGAAVGAAQGAKASKDIADLYQAEAQARRQGAMAGAQVAQGDMGTAAGMVGKQMTIDANSMRDQNKYNMQMQKEAFKKDADLQNDLIVEAQRASNRMNEIREKSRLNLRKTRAQGDKETRKTSDQIFKEATRYTSAPSRRRLPGLLKEMDMNVAKGVRMLESAGVKITKDGKLDYRVLEGKSTEELAEMFNAIDKQELAEAALLLVRILNPTGVVSDQAMDHILPKSLRIDMNNWLQYIQNEPKPAEGGKFVARIYKTLLAEQELAKERLTHVMTEVLANGIDFWIREDNSPKKTYVKNLVRNYNIDLDEAFPDIADDIRKWAGIKEKKKEDKPPNGKGVVEVERSVNGKRAVFDANTKKFIRWADGE